MSGSATFTMLESMISSSVPVKTAITTMRRRKSSFPSSAGSVRPRETVAPGAVSLMAANAHLRGEPDPQRIARGLIENDLHRYALHDLGEIPGGVVGRDERVGGACCGRDRFDVPLKQEVGEGVHVHLGLCAGVDSRNLGLLEVCDHPRRDCGRHGD